MGIWTGSSWNHRLPHIDRPKSQYGLTSSKLEKSVYVSLEFRKWGRKSVLSVRCERAAAYCTMNVAARLMDCNNLPSCLNPNFPVFFFASLSKCWCLLPHPVLFYCNPPPSSFLGSNQDVNASSVTSNPCYIPVFSPSPTNSRQYLCNGDLLHFSRNFFWTTCMNAFHARRSTSFNVLANATHFTIFPICGSTNCSTFPFSCTQSHTLNATDSRSTNCCCQSL